MTITFTEYQSFNLDNSVNDPVVNPSTVDINSILKLTAYSSIQVTYSGTTQDTPITLVLNGQFNTSAAPALGSTLAAVQASGSGNSLISSVQFSIRGAVAELQTFSKPVSASLAGLYGKSVLLAEMFFNEKEIFNTGSGQTNGDAWYGYSGYATLNDYHLYSSSDKDIFVGGTGGINTLTLPAKYSTYSIVPSNSIWDRNSQKPSLSGYVLTDNTKTYTTVQISAVQRVQFSDVSLALDVNGNAGMVAKVLGAVFGLSFVSNKTYMGIGLNFADQGMSEPNLINLALTARLGAGFSNAAEIQLLYQNLFGHSASTDEVNAIEALITSGTQTQVSLGVLAVESTNNMSNIGLVGLAQTGIQYTPYAT